MLKINYRGVIGLTLLYIFIPIIIFLLGWCKLYISIPCVLVILYIGYKMFNDYTFEQDNINISKFALIAVSVFFILVAYYLGWGRFTEQMNDYGKHNAVLNDLVLRPWPVIYTNVRGEHSMLTYYLGHYLVAGFVGKLFNSYRLSEIIFGLWSLFGLCLVYLNLIKLLKIDNGKKAIITAIVLIFFSCPLSIAMFIMPRLYDGMYIAGEWFWWSEDVKLQYSSNWCMLQWVVPQTVSTWLVITVLLQHFKCIKFYVPLLLPVLFTGSLAFVGILPFAFLAALKELTDKKIGIWIKQIFSIYNILFTITIGVIIILYFLGNTGGPKPEEVAFHILDYTDRKMLIVIFISIMVLPYFILIGKKFYRNWYYYLCLILLSIFPFFSMGLMNDFMMRTSIPALFVLMILILRFLFEIDWRKSDMFMRCCLYLTAALLIVSSILPVTFIYEQIINDNIASIEKNKSYATLEQFTDRQNKNIRPDRMYNYFTYDLGESLFYNHIASHHAMSSNIQIIPILPPDQIK